jgi:hypothetical protein
VGRTLGRVIAALLKAVALPGRGVVTSIRVGIKRVVPDGWGIDTTQVGIERVVPSSRITNAGGVGRERIDSRGAVVIGGRVKI